jgi:hypothetical protein
MSNETNIQIEDIPSNNKLCCTVSVRVVTLDDWWWKKVWVFQYGGVLLDPAAAAAAVVVVGAVVVVNDHYDFVRMVPQSHSVMFVTN